MEGTRVERMCSNWKLVAGWLVILATLLAGEQSAASAQIRPQIRPQAPAPSQQLYAYTLRHQPARDAVDVIQRMLSSEGKITFRQGSSTLEVRDTPEIVRQVASFLRSFDHPPLTLSFEVMVVRAMTLPVSPQPVDSPEIPRSLVNEWRKVLRFQAYRLLARAELEPRENEQVTYEMADGYRVSFRVGTLLANRRIKLHGLRLARLQADGESEATLIHSTLNPWVGRPTTLGIPQSGTDDRSALMLVVICRSPQLWNAQPPSTGEGSEGGVRR